MNKITGSFLSALVVFLLFLPVDLLEWESFFCALDEVETPDNLSIPFPAKYIGRYQIGRAYWLDSHTPGDWTDVLIERRARVVMQHYWQRYVPWAVKNRDFEVLARTHYGGPRGYMRVGTMFYWDRVRNAFVKCHVDNMSTLLLFNMHQIDVPVLNTDCFEDEYCEVSL